MVFAPFLGRTAEPEYRGLARLATFFIYTLEAVRIWMPWHTGKPQVQQREGPSRAVLGRTPFNGKAKPSVEGEGARILLVAVDLPDAKPPDGMPDELRAYALAKALRPHEEHFQHGAGSAHKAGKAAVPGCHQFGNAQGCGSHVVPYRLDVVLV